MFAGAGFFCTWWTVCCCFVVLTLSHTWHIIQEGDCSFSSPHTLCMPSYFPEISSVVYAYRIPKIQQAYSQTWKCLFMKINCCHGDKQAHRDVSEGWSKDAQCHFKSIISDDWVHAACLLSNTPERLSITAVNIGLRLYYGQSAENIQAMTTSLLVVFRLNETINFVILFPACKFVFFVK